MCLSLRVFFSARRLPCADLVGFWVLFCCLKPPSRILFAVAGTGTLGRGPGQVHLPGRLPGLHRRQQAGARGEAVLLAPPPALWLAGTRAGPCAHCIAVVHKRSTPCFTPTRLRVGCRIGRSRRFVAHVCACGDLADPWHRSRRGRHVREVPTLGRPICSPALLLLHNAPAGFGCLFLCLPCVTIVVPSLFPLPLATFPCFSLQPTSSLPSRKSLALCLALERAKYCHGRCGVRAALVLSFAARFCVSPFGVGAALWRPPLRWQWSGTHFPA
jgi:hypothetical protein